MTTATISRTEPATVHADVAISHADTATFLMPAAAATDGRSLYRLRAFVGHVAAERCERVVIDLSEARLLPAGFAQLLLNWHESGIDVLLARPRPHVRAMVWFRLFARPAGPAVWRVENEPAFEVPGTAEVACETEDGDGDAESFDAFDFGPEAAEAFTGRRPR